MNLEELSTVVQKPPKKGKKPKVHKRFAPDLWPFLYILANHFATMDLSRLADSNSWLESAHTEKTWKNQGFSSFYVQVCESQCFIDDESDYHPAESCEVLGRKESNFRWRQDGVGVQGNFCFSFGIFIHRCNGLVISLLVCIGCFGWNTADVFKKSTVPCRCDSRWSWCGRWRWCLLQCRLAEMDSIELMPQEERAGVWQWRNELEQTVERQKNRLV